MIMKFRRSEPNTGSIRLVNGAMAVLYFLICGMLIYFRFGPFHRVLANFEENGVAFPAWFNLVFTGGIVMVGLFLAFRGMVALKSFLNR